MAIYTTTAPTTGTFYTTASGSNGTWATLDNTSVSKAWTISAGDSSLTSPAHGTIKLSGENADIDINGVSLKQTLLDIQSRLAMLTPNPTLEKEWEELKELGDQYRKLEQEIKDKMKTWDILKKE